jgi:hypothetical protein
MVTLLMQVDPATAATAVTSVTGILSSRSDAMVILVLGLACLGLWLWKVHIPRQASEQKLRDDTTKILAVNSDTLAELSKVSGAIHATATHSNTTLNAMVAIKHMEVDCIEHIATKAGCDLTRPLSEIRGVLKAVEHGATVRS